MVKKHLFYLFHIFCSFTLKVCGEKNILPNLTADLNDLLDQHMMFYRQCFGSGSGRIRIILPDPDPYQEKLIWIRVPKKNS